MCSHPDEFVLPLTWAGAIGEHRWCTRCGALSDKADDSEHWTPWVLPYNSYQNDPKKGSSMTGNNTLELNQATIVEAVQMYLDSRFKEGCSPKVMKVATKSTNTYNQDTVFVFDVESPMLKAGL